MARFDFMRLGVKPFWNAPVGGNYSFDEHVLNDASEEVRWFFQCPEAGIITHLGFRYDSGSHSVGGGGPAPTYRIRLSSILGDGTPSTTPITSQTFQGDSSWDGTWRWIELIAPLQVTRGEFLAAIIDYSSGTIGSNNYSQFTTKINSARPNLGAFPYGSEVTTTDGRFSEQIVFAYKTPFRTYGWPIVDLEGTPVNSPEQVALRIWLNPAFGVTWRLAGAQIMGRLANKAGRSFTMLLYQGSTLLLDVTVDADFNSTHQDVIADILFDGSLPDLSFGTEYYLAFMPEETDTNFDLRVLEVPAPIDMTAFPGGPAFYYATRATSGAPWTLEKTKRPMVNLIIDDWTGVSA
jgi:hypothetical protein